MDEILNQLAKSTGETIGEHTQQLIDSLNIFKTMYAEYFDEHFLKEIETACKFHDYGKAVYPFQKLLGNEEIIKNKKQYSKIEDMYETFNFKKIIPHGYISPMFISKNICQTFSENYGADSIKRIVTAIFYHHTRDELPNDEKYKLKEIGSNDLEIRFEKLKLYYRIYSKLYSLNELINEKCWAEFAVVLGMLNKFDYYASDTTYNKLPIEINRAYNERYLNEYVMNFFTSNNFKINDCQKYALTNTENNIIIVASTGIGKTETALLWADGKKLFYTLPLKVSINAMKQRISENYGYDKDKVVLLHSSALEELIDNEESDENTAIIKYDAVRKFSYPVTVCTIDQIFSFVYKYHGCEQFIATLKYSKLVIDEIQSYEPKIIAKILYGLKIISLIGGQFAIITATLPPFIYEMIQNMNIKCNQPKQFLMNDKIRHKVHIIEDSEFDFNEISKKAKTKKILIICNTIKRACEVYNNLKDACEYIKLLHSNFILKDRKKLENEFIQFSNDINACGVCISTQIVEASLDIDFDNLYTEMATADSLLQRMGRCYRKRDYSNQSEPNIYILNNNNGKTYVYDADIYNRSLNLLYKYNDTFFSEKDKMLYIDAVYKSDEIVNTKYYKSIAKELETLENIVPFQYKKSEAKYKFRGITNYTVIPKRIYDEYTNEFEYAVNVLTGKIKCDRIEKTKQRKFINDHSLAISKFDKRKNNLSKLIFSSLDYYVIQCKYDFNENTLSGLGLSYDFEEGDCFF